MIVERRPHRKTAYGDSGSETAFWRSLNKIITVHMFLPRPEYEEAITKYLGLYPSSLTANDFPAPVSR